MACPGAGGSAPVGRWLPCVFLPKVASVRISSCGLSRRAAYSFSASSSRPFSRRDLARNRTSRAESERGCPAWLWACPGERACAFRLCVSPEEACPAAWAGAWAARTANSSRVASWRGKRRFTLAGMVLWGVKMFSAGGARMSSPSSGRNAIHLPGSRRACPLPGFCGVSANQNSARLTLLHTKSPINARIPATTLMPENAYSFGSAHRAGPTSVIASLHISPATLISVQDYAGGIFTCI